MIFVYILLSDQNILFHYLLFLQYKYEIFSIYKYICTWYLFTFYYQTKIHSFFHLLLYSGSIHWYFTGISLISLRIRSLGQLQTAGKVSVTGHFLKSHEPPVYKSLCRSHSFSFFFHRIQFCWNSECYIILVPSKRAKWWFTYMYYFFIIPSLHIHV